MTDINRIKELQAAYLCLKESVADDLISYSELKHVLQYAGFNPISAFMQQWWIEGETINFEQYCKICSELNPISDDYIRNLIASVFIVNNDQISIKDVKNLLAISKRKKGINDYDIDLLIDEVGAENGFLKVSSISKIICDTITALKKYSLNSLESKSHQQRLSSRTYTKNQLISEIKKDSTTVGNTSLMHFNDWNISSLKGCFFLNEDSIISHQYTLEISTMGPVVIKINCVKSASTIASADPIVYIFRETTDGVRNYLGYTNLTNIDGSNYWTDTLKEGKYILIPYAGGSYLRKNGSISNSRNVMTLINTDGQISLSEDCVKVLEDIFNQMDLDNNGLLNRQEFNLYNWRTSAEIVQDDEWEVVQTNFEVQNGELTLNGFISLHRLEAEDNDGDSEDLWLSLETIGYNRYGEQDKAAPYILEVYGQCSKPILLVSGLKSGGSLIDKALVRSVMEDSEPLNICGRSDLIKYQYFAEQRAAIVIQNKSNDKIRMFVDCSKSINCISNRQNLYWEVDINKKSAIVAHQLVPKFISEPWKVVTSENIISD